MAGKIVFDLVSPDRLLVSTEVDQVDVPGSEGDFGAMAGHQALVASLRPGLVVLHDAGRGPIRYFVRGGFAEVTAERCTVLAEHAIAVADLDRAELERQLKDANEDIADAKSDDDRHRANQLVGQLADLITALA
ncbi:MAG: F0F1 ATP synthase subunit epsilon [Alphaproteobacteria bacterium]|nr:F0F1 ATP synthase subunit epsilon [Alphaproteobacteria bacterium]